ncbi:MAG: hypothetical protein QOJ16_4633 [Acidobacteriota bacterium]|jgi:hypothetical protein|nr:hypothetical protein [Acidobacteriota bacterium]
MSTAPITPSVTPPVNPAKGPLRGQTTLAAEIDRWQTLVDNLTPQVDQMPGLKEPLAQFQVLLAQAKAIRNHIHSLRADTDSALTQRNQLLVDGGDLFGRLSLGLQSAHGPRSPRLREFGLKPRKLRTGRPRKTPSTPVEVTAVHPPATTAPAAVVAPAAVASPMK